jgi:hypothetical protein
VAKTGPTSFQVTYKTYTPTRNIEAIIRDLTGNEESPHFRGKLFFPGSPECSHGRSQHSNARPIA